MKTIEFEKSENKGMIKCKEVVNFELDALIYAKAYTEQQLWSYDNLISAIELIEQFKKSTKKQNDLLEKFRLQLVESDIDIKIPEDMMSLDLDLSETLETAKKDRSKILDVIWSYDK